ncbi:hypothetical protein [Halalkalicoccus salilacus]|uniref:hypothetical protein n=1 Tax=Halalkalicoccus TaxID=332246 RepID=UPI002F963564
MTTHKELRANFSIAVPIDADADDEPTVTGVTSGSGSVQMIEQEREGVRGPRGW